MNRSQPWVVYARRGRRRHQLAPDCHVRGAFDLTSLYELSRAALNKVRRAPQSARNILAAWWRQSVFARRRAKAKSRRLILTVGYQRSGTTVLFRSVEAANPAISFNESPDNPLFKSKDLRRQSEILPVVDKLGGVVVAKANKLFSAYDCSELAQRYSAFRIHVVWSFRNPLHVYASHWSMVNGGVPIAAHPAEADKRIVEGMVMRNRRVLDGAARGDVRALFLSHDAACEGADYRALLKEFCGLDAVPKQRLRGSPHAAQLPPQVAQEVLEQTRGVYAEMRSLYDAAVARAAAKATAESSVVHNEDAASAKAARN
jgi:hypothetical protein